jgi:hypothetical protein
LFFELELAYAPEVGWKIASTNRLKLAAAETSSY